MIGLDKALALAIYQATEVVMAEHVIELPVRHPQLFSPDINRQMLANGKLYFLLYSAIKALPYIEQREHREDLKRALCDLLLWDDPAA